MLSEHHEYTVRSAPVHGAMGATLSPIRDALGRLSPRQQEAVELAAAGKTNKEIANALGVTVNTARVHLRTAMKVLDIHRRSQLAPLAALTAKDVVIDIDSLTASDVAITALVAQGKSDKEICRHHGLTIGAVKAAMRRIRRAAGGGTRTKAAVAFLARPITASVEA